MEDLLQLRQEIDEIDQEMVRLFEKRMDVSRRVAEYKIANGKKILDCGREVQKLESLGELAHSDFNRHGVQELFQQIMSMSRKLQYQLLTKKGVVGRLPFTQVEQLEKKNGREPTMEELAKEVGSSAEELVMAMEAVSDVESLSQTIYSSDGSPVLLGDRLPDEQDQTEALLNRILLRQLLGLLDSEEQHIIHLRYFEDCTQMQVAAALGMTQVQVSRAEKRILRKLREAGRT